jgi:hypothetical protein
MKVQELPARAYLAHLRRHPVPELMDEECVAALANVEAQFGDTITHGAGLEVRLGNPARFVDYIMCVDQDYVPGIQSIWYEIDYADYLRGGDISPCLFVNTSDYKEEKADQQDHTSAENDNVQRQDKAFAPPMGKKFWDSVLPPFAGEKRAARLRGQLDRILAALPQDATIKQIGTMSPRGELDILRLVVIFHRWESIFAWLRDVGWPGDAGAMEQALLPWKEAQGFAVNIDLGESGLLEKTGLEVFGRWRHPLLVDKFIERLEAAGLCLPSKGAALRRWIRILPDADPFIQTLVTYFKLNYAKGRVTEAKAYLEQSPYIHHHYFAAYDRPLYLELELAEGKETLPAETALALIRDCGKNRVRHVRFTGGAAGYEALPELLRECRKQDVAAEIVITEPAREGWLSSLVAAGADAFLVDMADENDEAALTVLHTLQKLGFANVRARWYMHKGNAGRLEAVVKTAAGSGVRELLLTGAKPQPGSKTKTQLPDRAQMETAAAFIREYEGNPDSSSPDSPQETKMLLTVESCFSQLRAVMGGKEAKRNPNMGIERGCEAGKSFFAVRADGSFTPCLLMAQEDGVLSYKNLTGENTGELQSKVLPEGEAGRPAAGASQQVAVCNGAEGIVAYWEKSPVLQALRSSEEGGNECESCCYKRRCLPCRACEDADRECRFR